jgi:LysM repeat protein
MGLESIRIRWLVIAVLLVVPLLVAGCNRSAPQPEEEQPEQETTLETTEQVMPTGEETTPAEPETTEPQPAETTADQPAPAEETTAEATPAEQPAETVEEAPPAEAEPAEEAPAAEKAYIVMPGDTLFSIAQTYGVSVEEVAARNGILNVNRIEVGQQLIIPAPGAAPAEESTGTGERVHVVQAGENLFRISLAYNMSFETVAAYNSIPWPYTIHVGQEIKIPPVP